MFDFPRGYQISFQDPASPIMEGIIDLHHNILFYLILIFALVLWMLRQIIFRSYYYWEFPDKITMKFRKHFLILNNVVHGTWLEIIWTIIPSLILMLIAVPSFALLYSIDEVVDPAITIKVIGHQWFWSYEYSDYFVDGIELNFESYMINEADLKVGDLRLLEVDNPLVLPVNTHIRVIVTSTDVLHSFAVPSLGLKVDAVPGRLNQLSLFIKRPGVFYGQCSELCGVNHGFMPIVIHGVNLDDYITFVKA